MVKRVEIPGVGNVEFPDEMDEVAISRAIETDILPKAKQAPGLIGQVASGAVDTLGIGIGQTERTVGDIISATPEGTKGTIAALAGQAAKGLGRALSSPRSGDIDPRTGRPYLGAEAIKATGESLAGFANNTVTPYVNQALQEGRDSASATLADPNANPINKARLQAGGFLSDLGKSTQDFYQRKLAEEAPIVAAQSKAIQDAEGFVPTVLAAAKNPLGVAAMIGQSAPELAVGMGLGRVAALSRSGVTAAAQAAGEKAFQETLLKAASSPSTLGDARRLAREAQARAVQEHVANASARAGGAVGLATEAAQSAGATRGQVQDFVEQQPDQALLANNTRYRDLRKTMDEAMAKRVLGDELGAQAAGQAGVWTAAAGKITGAADAFGKTISGQKVTLRQAASGAGKEALEEMAQNPGEDFAAYQAKVQADPTQKFDLGGSMAQGMIGGAAMGGAMHGGGYVISAATGELKPAPVKLAGRAIDQYTTGQLQAYLKSGALTEPVRQKIAAELEGRTQAPTNEAQPQGDQLDSAIQRFAADAGIAADSGIGAEQSGANAGRSNGVGGTAEGRQGGLPPTASTLVGGSGQTEPVGATITQQTQALDQAPGNVIPQPVTAQSVIGGIEQRLAEDRARADAEVIAQQERRDGSAAIIPEPNAANNFQRATDTLRVAGVGGGHPFVGDGSDVATREVHDFDVGGVGNTIGLAAGRQHLAEYIEQQRERGVNIKPEGLPQLSPIRDARLAREAQAVGDVLHAVTGVRHFMFEDAGKSAPDGMTFRGQSYLNAANLHQSLAFTAFHETFHVAEARAKRGDAAASKFVQVVGSIFDDQIKEDARAKYVSDHPNFGGHSLQEVMANPAMAAELKSEMVADFMGKRGEDVQWLRHVARKNPSGFGGFIRVWIDRLSNLIAEFRAKRDLGNRDVDRYISKLSHAKAVAASAFIEWRRANPQFATSAPSPGTTGMEVRARTQEVKPQVGAALAQRPTRPVPTNPMRTVPAAAPPPSALPVPRSPGSKNPVARAIGALGDFPARIPQEQAREEAPPAAGDVAASTEPTSQQSSEPTSQQAKTKVFRTRAGAYKAQKDAGNTTKIRKVKGGYILREKTDKEIAAEAKAAKRLRAGVGIDVENDTLLTAIAKSGGISFSERADTIGQGNRNFGGKMLFTANGKEIDILASEVLSELGYVPPYELERDGGSRWLRDAIREEFMGLRKHHSLQGQDWMQEAMAERDRQFDDEQVLSDFMPDDLEETGYTAAAPEVQQATEALLAEAEAIGIDRETLIEDAARATADDTEEAYHAEVQRLARAAIAAARENASAIDTETARGSDQDHRQVAGDQGREESPDEGLSLQSQTEADLRDKAARETAATEAARKKKAAEQEALRKRDEDRDLRARADATADDFQLGQSAEQQMSGMGDMFATEPSTQTSQTAAAYPAKEKTTAKPAGGSKIEDFGEKLTGARKDYATTLKDAESIDVAAEPLSKSWPEPDYQKLLDGGADPFTVAFVHAVRDEIPTKPQKTWKLKGWVEQVTMLRDMASKLVNGQVSATLVTEPMDAPKYDALKRNLGSRLELYQLVGHGQSLKGVTFAERHYSLYRGQQNVNKWVVERQAKATMFGNWPTELAVGDTKQEMLDQFVAKLKEQQTGKGAKAPNKGQFVIYRKRGVVGAFIGKKIGREYIDLHKAADVGAARKYLEANAADLEAALEKYKDTPFERKTENQPRVGDDHRNGAPVTPEVFAQAFGFRGVQFGNYVEQGRRQSDLNQAFDGLMDLAAVLGLPPRALSLNGSLGLAFGARGSGGKNAPVAHYEPGKIVINLTKGGGPGSLAHEWWHSVDNYFGKEFGEGGFVTGGASSDRMRAAMGEAFNVVKRATQAPTLRRRAEELDKRRSKPYWNTPLELSARAFESYVIAKLQDQSAANDYLANVADEKVWNAYEARRAAALDKQAVDSYPYPLQAEIPAVRAAFDNFFQTVDTKTDDDGNVAMFSRKQSAPWYSALQRRLETADMRAGPAQGWKALIKGLVAKGDVKADEVQWSGLEEWLDLQPGKVSRDAVLAYLSANGVQVQEEVLQDARDAPSKWRVVDDFGNKSDLFDTEAEAYAERERQVAEFVWLGRDRERAEEAIEVEEVESAPEASTTKYSEYTLPGGANYREVLLTLPTKAQPKQALTNWTASRFSEAAGADYDGWSVRGTMPNGEVFRSEIGIEEAATEAEAIAAGQRVAGLHEMTDVGPAVNYRSNHWKQPNILAHIRVNDRIDAEGARVLFVEEIQSDYGQDAKKRGFSFVKHTTLNALNGKTQEYPTEAEARAEIAEGGPTTALQYRKIGVAGVPRAPFVDKTDKWVALALKRVIKMAVDEGYDKVAFVSGEQSAQRYDLSKQVGSIDVERYDLPGVGPVADVRVIGLNGRQVHNEDGASMGRIEELIGKEMAQRISEQAPETRRQYSGDGLKVGGAGMISFYDKIVPSVAKDVLRKLGGGPLETVTFPKMPGGKIVRRGDIEIKTLGDSEQNGFTITDKMRAAAADGMPMFSNKRPPGGGSLQPPAVPGGHLQAEVPDETKVEAGRRVVQDQHIRMRKLREWALENGAKLSAASDVYGAEERMHGRTATRVEDFREKVVKPLVERTQKEGYTLEQVAEVLHAEHAEERNKQIARINDQMPDGGSGMTTADARAILAKTSPKLRSLAADWQAITTRSRDILLRAGIIGQDQAGAWGAAYKHYVPLKGGDEADAAKRAGIGKGLSVNGKTKRALGHGERDEHIIENILRDHERAITLAEKNRVGQAMMLFLSEVADERIGTVDQPKKRAVLMPGYQYDVRGAGMSVAVFDTEAEAKKFIRQQIAANSPGAARLNIVKVGADPSVQYRASPMLEENEAQVYVNGHAVRIQLNDQKLAQAYKRLGAEPLGRWLEISRDINTYLSKAYTGYNPAFIPRNMIRDFGSGVIKLTGNFGAGTTAGVLARYPAALGTLLRYSYSGTSTPSIDAYRAAGGSTGAAYLGDLERVGKDIQHTFEKYQGAMALLRAGKRTAAAKVASAKLVGGLVGWIEHLNAATENAMRLAAFEQILKETGSTEQAASAAKNATVNFNRKGERGPALGAMYLFFNPNVQDTAAVIETFTRGKHRWQAIALTAAMVGITYTLAALQFGGGDDDYERWKKISDSVRNKNLVLRTGEDSYVTIPVPFGFGFFHALGNSIFMAQKGESAGQLSIGVASNLMDHFSPVGNPLQGAKGWDSVDPLMFAGLIPGAPGTGELGRDAVRAAVNRSVFGSPIVPDSKFDEERPDFLRTYRSTKGTKYDVVARGLSDLTGGTGTQGGAIDMSPETLKFWTSVLTGGAGTFLSDMTHLIGLGVRATVTDGPDRAALAPEMKEIPIARDYVKTEGMTDSRRAFWDAAGEVRSAMADLRRARKGDDQVGEDRVLSKHGELIALDKTVSSFGKMISSQRDRVDEVNADKTTSLAYKRAAIQRLEKEEAGLYNEFLHMVTEAKAMH